MVNFDGYTNESKIEHSSKWSYIPDHPYRILLDLINNQPDIDKIYVCAKDPYEAKYQHF